MANNPLNLALRFLLELTALGAFGYWGWTQHSGIWRWVFTLCVPLIAATIWGVFRVPGDPGDAPVAVPGIVRLALEAVFFIGAVAAVYASDQSRAAIALAVIIITHYILSYDRVVDLLSR